MHLSDRMFGVDALACFMLCRYDSLKAELRTHPLAPRSQLEFGKSDPGSLLATRFSLIEFSVVRPRHYKKYSNLRNEVIDLESLNFPGVHPLKQFF